MHLSDLAHHTERLPAEKFKERRLGDMGQGASCYLKLRTNKTSDHILLMFFRSHVTVNKVAKNGKTEKLSPCEV